MWCMVRGDGVRWVGARGVDERCAWCMMGIIAGDSGRGLWHVTCMSHDVPTITLHLGIHTSLDKLIAIVETCQRLGVHMTPQR